jgi:tetratricopeptide (TPR) repeat protein
MVSADRLLIVFVSLSLLSFVVSGQDLGSSNKLFGPSTRAAAPAKAKTSRKTPKRVAKRARSWANNVAPATTVGSAGVQPENPTASVKSPSTPPSGAANNELFEELIGQANTARDQRNYAVAEAVYERAKAIKPTDVRAIYGLGNLYSDQLRWEDAENACRAALKIEPSNSMVNVALSHVLSQPLMVANLSDRYAEAEKLARKAIELAPSNAMAFDQLGVAMELLGSTSSETEHAYRSAIRLAPTLAPAHAHLARLLRRRGESKEAAKAYENAIHLANDVPTTIRIAEILQSDQRYAESEPLLRRAIANDPKNAAGLLLYGKALTVLGNFAEAEKVLNLSLAVSTDGFLPNSLLGSLYVRQGKFELAENALMRAARSVSPGQKRNLSLRFETVGDGYMKGGNRANAARAYQQALALDPENPTLSGKLTNLSTFY